MKSKYNKSGTVSIQQMPKEMYYAILSILGSAERSFEWNEEEKEWCSNDDFLCSLSPEEKAALDKANWTI